MALLVVVACTAAVPAVAQVDNEIVAVDPATAAQGTTGLLVTFTLDSDSPPAPPAGVLPDAATIGAITGGSLGHPTQYEVSAVFDIPFDAPVGPADCAVSFTTPNGALVFSSAGGFTVTAGADTPPTITQHPQSRTVREGAAVSFAVAATGSEPIDYQWQRDEADIDGATASRYSIDEVVAADAGGYRCVVHNDFGAAISDIAVLMVDTGPATADNSSLVPDTRQELCYDELDPIVCPGAGAPFAGQDAQHLGFQPSFTVSGDGLTVADATTGLVWQASPDTDGDGVVETSDKLNWTAAQGRPAVLNATSYGGFDDWRLPTITELYSLIDFRGTDPSGLVGNDTSGLAPFIDTDFFDFAYGDPDAGERIIDSQYASSTLYVAGSPAEGGKLFGVNFADGRIKGYGLTVMGGDKTFFVQCVRGNTAYGASILHDNGDGTATDLASDLMWARADSGVALGWAEALAWVESQNAVGYLGHDDWRLPNVKELQSLLDYTRSPDSSASAAIDPLLEVTPITNEGGEADFPWYWSSTTHADHTDHGGFGSYVCFGRGLGWMQLSGDTCYTLVDVHGAGAQRSDPKSGSPASYYLGTACSGGSAYGHGPQGDVIRIVNFVRLVRGGEGPVTADFSLSPATPLAGQTVTFSATASGGLSPYDFRWDLGGTAAVGHDVSHTFTAGSHVIVLTVTDGAGFTATSSWQLEVGAGAGTIFADDFESGDTSAWSAVGP